MRRFKRLFHFLALAFMLLGYQGCGLNYSIPEQFNISSKNSGNGGGYEGKIDGAYYRFIPNYTCEGSPAPDQVAEIKNGQAYIYENKSTQCSKQSTPISVSDINISPFQNEFISVNDALFKRYEIKPQGIPSNLAEVLCRDDFESPSFEIVSHYDRDTNEVRTRVYFPQSIESDFPTGRILSPNEVEYVSDKIKFKVDLSKPAMLHKKFAGRIESTSLSGMKSHNLTCVIGGSLDTSNWSLRQLSDLSTSTFDIFGSGEIFFPVDLAPFVTHTYKIGLDNSVTDFTKAILGDNYSSLENFPIADKNLRVFSARAFSETFSSWYVFNSKQARVTRLTNLQAGATSPNYMLDRPEVTQNQHLIYEETNISSQLMILHDFDIQSNNLIDIFSSLSRVVYKTLANSNKVIIGPLNNGDFKKFKIYDVATRSMTDLPIDILSSCTDLRFSLETFNSEQSVLISSTCDDTIDTVLVSLSDGSVKQIAKNKFLLWISDDRKWILLGDAVSSSKNPMAYNTETGDLLSVSIDPRLGYDSASNNFSAMQFPSKIVLIDNQWLYGFGGDPQSPSLYQINLTTKSTRVLCEGVLGKKLFVGALPDQRIYLFTYDSLLKLYRFYYVKSESECLRINEFPSVHSSVPDLKSTNIGFGLALNDGNNQPSKEVVFVPIDGRPPLKLNPTDKGPWKIDVSADKNRVILAGPASDGIFRIFSFDLK